MQAVHVGHSIRRICHVEESVGGSFEHLGVHLGSAKGQKVMNGLGQRTYICSAMNCGAFELLAIELLNSRLEIGSSLELNEAIPKSEHDL